MPTRTFRPPRRLPRRLLLGGGVALASPLLDAMLPRNARAAAAMHPRRMLLVFFPNGVVMFGDDGNRWRPAATGRAYELTRQMQGLAPVKDDVLVLSGISNRPANASGGAQHWTGTANFATGAIPEKGRLGNGISVDQLAARAIGDRTKLPSLVLSCDTKSYNLGDFQGYSKAYKYNVSWTSATTPVPVISNPAKVFDQLFGAASTDAERARLRAENRSILDFALADYKRLTARVGVEDRRKLDEFATSVSELEKKIFASPPAAACTAEGTPTPLPNPPTDAEYPKIVDQMISLVELAFACDLTRIVSLMLAPGQSHRTYNFIGVPGEHHKLSHYEPAKVADFVKVVAWNVSRLASIVGRLRARSGPAGRTLLDDTLVYMSTEIGDGNAHSLTDVPVLLAGRGGGLVQPSRHVRYATPQPRARVLNTLLAAVGAGHGAKVGEDGEGLLPELTG